MLQLILVEFGTKQVLQQLIMLATCKTMEQLLPPALGHIPFREQTKPLAEELLYQFQQQHLPEIM